MGNRIDMTGPREGRFDAQLGNVEPWEMRSRCGGGLLRSYLGTRIRTLEAGGTPTVFPLNQEGDETWEFETSLQVERCEQ